MYLRIEASMNISAVASRYKNCLENTTLHWPFPLCCSLVSMHTKCLFSIYAIGFMPTSDSSISSANWTSHSCSSYFICMTDCRSRVSSECQHNVKMLASQSEGCGFKSWVETFLLVKGLWFKSSVFVNLNTLHIVYAHM